MNNASDKSLESWIWDAACSIRGAQEAPKFKDFILPLIFAKRLCDVFDDELNRIPERAVMNIEVTCRGPKPFKEMVTVYALTFVPETRTFTMPLCSGDDWGQIIKCPIAAVPSKVHLQWDQAFIEFEKQNDAAAFCVWLAEAEAKAREGYRTMRG